MCYRKTTEITMRSFNPYAVTGLKENLDQFSIGYIFVGFTNWVTESESAIYQAKGQARTDACASTIIQRYAIFYSLMETRAVNCFKTAD